MERTMNGVRTRLVELGIELPVLMPPLASYVPAIRTANLVYTAGQVHFVDGKLLQTGKVGAEVTAAEAASTRAPRPGWRTRR